MADISKLLLEQKNALLVSARKKERKKPEPLPNKLGLPVIVSWHIVRQLGR